MVRESCMQPQKRSMPSSSTYVFPNASPLYLHPLGHVVFEVLGQVLPVQGEENAGHGAQRRHHRELVGIDVGGWGRVI